MRANILCAGFGTRLRPFTYLKPKPLLNIGGYPLVERTIRQLHADGVTDIALVVGYKHECFNYLVDKYGVQLIISAQYATANNYSSLQLVAHRLATAWSSTVTPTSTVRWCPWCVPGSRSSSASRPSRAMNGS